jgi:hypothetical protein
MRPRRVDVAQKVGSMGLQKATGGCSSREHHAFRRVDALELLDKRRAISTSGEILLTTDHLFEQQIFLSTAEIPGWREDF